MGLANVLKYLTLGVLRGYQLIVSPLLGPACRFYPTCSKYALEAVHRHGVVRGLLLTIKRFYELAGK